MTRRRLQLNVLQSRVDMLPLRNSTGELLGTPLGYSPESGAAGGADFSYQRQFRAAATVHDALPTTDGYVSVSYKDSKHDAVISVQQDHVYNLYGCDQKPRATLLSEPEFVGLAHLPQGTLAWKRGLAAIIMGNGRQEIKGIDLKDPSWVACIGASGRIVAATDTQIYWSGVNDNLDFTPSLSSGAGSATYTAEIGQVVNLVESAEGFYVLGSHGAIHGQCTGDSQYPYQFKPVMGFRGIKHKKNCVVKYGNIGSLYAWTERGLQIIKGLQADDVEPELSFALMQGTYTALRPTEHENIYYECPREYRDNFDCTTTNIAVELKLDVDDIRVQNLDNRYTVVSYGGGNAVYNQCYIIDMTLGRSAIVNVVHTDFHEGLRLVSNGIFRNMLTDGGTENATGKYLLHDVRSLQSSVSTVTKLLLTGRLNQDEYTAAGNAESRVHPLQYVQALQGVDVRGSAWLPYGLSLTFARQNEVQYAGRLRQYYLSLLVPFVGHMSGLFLDI